VVPYYELGRFGMFAFHFKSRTTTIIDPSPLVTNVAYNNHPSYYYLPRLQKVAKTFDRAMDVVDPSWNDDIFDWQHVFPSLVPKLVDR
jgi:hypothetical protein